MPRFRSCRSTIRRRRSAKGSSACSPSVDVVVEGGWLMHQDLASPGGDHPGALELCEEAARALAGWARELRGLGLGLPAQNLARLAVARPAGAGLPLALHDARPP